MSEQVKLGRPVLYDDPDVMMAKATEYFQIEEDLGDKCCPTINGLCLHLGMTRETLLRYGEKPAFSDVVNFIRMRLVNSWERRLAMPNATGTIFWLKNQGWSDKSEMELSGRNGGPMETVTRIELVGKVD